MKLYEKLIHEHKHTVVMDNQLLEYRTFKEVLDSIIDNSFEFHNSGNLDYGQFINNVVENWETYFDIYEYEIYTKVKEQ